MRGARAIQNRTNDSVTNHICQAIRTEQNPIAIRKLNVLYLWPNFGGTIVETLAQVVAEEVRGHLLLAYETRVGQILCHGVIASELL